MIYWLESVDSTNRHALSQRLPRWDAVVAREQVAGCGRRGRSWESPVGGLYLSVVVENDPLLPLRTGLAARDALQPYCPERIGLKWPNDLLCVEGKLGGVLCEAEGDRAVAGIGLNLAGEPPIEDATTLEAAGGSLPPAVDWQAKLEPLATAIIARLRELARLPAPEFLMRYRVHEQLLGQPVAWEGGRGTALAVGADGTLEVRTAAGTERLHAGEVSLA
ncbi:MAG: biotin--[acetyl-CoA-carboxylase] ligase [Marine Group III euryarchaeote CG-Bathy2]|uniref:Biotin--protein ligase (BirA) n=3 Tax=Methanobacteriati TaxID=3366610 RepID=A0A075G7Z1_9EURY|nr:biotin--protein ligase (birA) [uncultured marine group II/III euryarchaeote KM3_110_C01]AIF01997.1 biotin--protein ligase (birA) [uncultured marine group II/III euryarchaeote KM3_152_H07]OIR11265.1 MAG: biotin--[acetyl-CoA-carboxylase] ligase [Marine Group III euryarchaeote CG-Bathy2]